MIWSRPQVACDISLSRNCINFSPYSFLVAVPVCTWCVFCFFIYCCVFLSCEKCNSTHMEYLLRLQILVCLGSRFLRFSCCVFPFFFFLHAFSPHLWLLFMHGIWTVATTFDQFSVNSTWMYCSRTHKFHFLSIFSLKMGPTVLFTHLKIILLQ